MSANDTNAVRDEMPGAADAAPDRRRATRHRVFKAGTIAFNRAGGISCMVRNISAAGACLEVVSPMGIPDEFTLQIENDHIARRCHVTWRKNKRIGVVFD
jgi:hypothetical protein